MSSRPGAGAAAAVLRMIHRPKEGQIPDSSLDCSCGHGVLSDSITTAEEGQEPTYGMRA